MAGLGGGAARAADAMKPITPHRLFARLAQATATGAGHPVSFALAVIVVAVWGACGPFFAYSDTWQLIINTSTTVVTFWMVFLLQATTMRDTAAIQAKLDELIRIHEKARNDLIGVEKRDEPPRTFPHPYSGTTPPPPKGWY
jgi:low affinity Fe/Cu permease